MKYGLACSLAMFTLGVSAQPIDTVMLSEIGRFHFPYWEAPSTASYYALHSRIDRLDRPYVYMACVEHGLVTLDITDPSSPLPVDTIWPTELGNLKVTNVEQVDELLYLCLGGFEGTTQTAGLATVDVSDPAQPTLLDVWTDASFNHGASCVRVQDGVAYLGAMESGVVVLDVGDPGTITFIGSYLPDPTWPGIAGYPPAARGITIEGDRLYLAYDAGGLRILSIDDPSALVELGRYVNPMQPALTPPAYNNVSVIGYRAYVAVDFCGLEVVDVGTPSAMAQQHWLDPWECVGFSWFGSDGHANEMATTQGDSLLFMSAGDSEVLVYDISSEVPVLRGGHILPNDTAAAWGVDVHGELVVASFVNNANLPLQPYYSRFGGIVIFAWSVDHVTHVAERSGATFAVSPNPSNGTFTIIARVGGPAELVITDAIGRLVCREPVGVIAGTPLPVDLSGRSPGMYFISLRMGDEASTVRTMFQVP